MALPFVKWMGGKRTIADAIIAKMPNKITRYYETFTGGGAVFFRLQELKLWVGKDA